MAGELGVAQQVARMLNVLKHCDQDNLSKCLNGEVSVLSLVYPLLPLLPQQPSPTMIAELLRETATTTPANADTVKSKDKCHMCGNVGTNYVTCCVAPASISEAGPKRRQMGPKRSSLDKMMEVIDQRVNDTLQSIENTTARFDELDKQRKELDESGKPIMTDTELLQRLKSLAQEKMKLEQRVKILQDQERQIKESLITEFELIKPISMLSAPKLSKLLSQHDNRKSKVISLGQETPEEKQIAEVLIDKQFLTEKGTSEENIYLGNVQDNESEGELIIVNIVEPSDETSSEKSHKSA